MRDELFKLPAHHVYTDGSVGEVFVKAYADHDWMAVSDGNTGIILLPEQARSLSRVLLIAADLLEKSLQKSGGAK